MQRKEYYESTGLIKQSAASKHFAGKAAASDEPCTEYLSLRLQPKRYGGLLKKRFCPGQQARNGILLRGTRSDRRSFKAVPAAPGAEKSRNDDAAHEIDAQLTTHPMPKNPAPCFR